MLFKQTISKTKLISSTLTLNNITHPMKTIKGEKVISSVKTANGDTLIINEIEINGTKVVKVYLNNVLRDYIPVNN